jgi:hypothetical protein
MTEFEQQVFEALHGLILAAAAKQGVPPTMNPGLLAEPLAPRVAAAISAVQNETLQQFGITPLRLTPISGAMITGAALAALRGP